MAGIYCASDILSPTYSKNRSAVLGIRVITLRQRKKEMRSGVPLPGNRPAAAVLQPGLGWGW
jgi:hypothetical protein